MPSKHSFNRKIKELKLGLYGRYIKNGVAYCKLHQCWLRPYDITVKRCNYKKCPYFNLE